MTLIEILLIILVILVAAFLVYWFFQGSSRRISLRRPVESRIDEYLDRRFERLIEEWDLVQRPRMKRFSDSKNAVLQSNEDQIRTMHASESGITTTLNDLEARLNALESTLEIRKE